MSRARLPILAATAAAALVAGLAVTDSASANSTSSKLSPGIKTSSHSLAGAKAKLAGKLPVGVPKKGNYSFLLRLSTRSTGAVYNATRRSAGKAAARDAAKSQLASVRAAQNRVIAALPANSRVLYRTHAALAGVSVRTNVKNFGTLRAMSGVTAVYPISPKSRSNRYAVPLQGAPAGWEAHGNLGEGSIVAVIDTGVDYTHANFGGTGTSAAYDAEKARNTQTPDPATYDAAKFGNAGVNGRIGMYDFVGDDYNADPSDPAYDPVPAPDPNPLDCNSHGSHVAGTVAGYGEDDNGNTYDGTYDTNTDFASMRIGPGMAPRATLYAYKVFGCEGSTDVVGEAIDRALDPNSDGSTSDHVDVINMSLGADYGSPQDADSVISDMAASLGISVVAAAGNAGDVYDVGGSPADAPRVIAAAASTDAYSQVDALHVSGPSSIDGDYPAERSVAYDWANDPDLQGTVARVEDPTNLEGCQPLSSADQARVNGKIAFVEWTSNDADRPCGSATRSGNLADAGAIGFILGDDEENFSAGITGSAVIPGVLVAKSGADAIRGALLNGQTVTISGTTANGFAQLDPGHNDQLAGFSSRGIRDAGNVKPDVAAVGESVFSTSMGTGNQGQNDSGTSMATPMVAGEAALITAQHTDWTAEQVKADIMNTATQDVFLDRNHGEPAYAPNRVGAGRIRVDKALDNTVLAYVTNDPGSVSASFGPLAITPSNTPTVRTKTIKVENTGDTVATYDVSYDARTVVPGAVYSVSPATVAVDPHASKLVTVTLTIHPGQLTKTMDPTVEAFQSGLPRQFVADASGVVVFEPTAGSAPKLRVPVYSAPRPASAMSQPSTVVLPSGGVQQTLMPLSGKQVNQGSGSEKVQSTVAGFELQGISGTAPSCSHQVTSECISIPDDRAADLKYVGATSNATQLRSNGENPSEDGLMYFAINTRGAWRTAASANEFDIYMDTNRDGVPDLVTFNTRFPDTDVLVDETIDLNTGDVVDVQLLNDSFGDTDTAIFDSDTLIMPVAISAMGFGVRSRLSYGVATYSGSGAIDEIGFTSGGDLTGALSFNPLRPGLAVYGSYDGGSSPLLFADTPGAVLKVRRDTAAYAADHGKGALMVHFHNVVGQKAQVVALKTAPKISLSFSPSPATRLKVTTATVTVSNTSGMGATGTAKLVRLTGPNAPVTVATGTVSNGTAKLKYTPQSSGTYKYQAQYGGDKNYVARNSGPVTLTIH